MSNEQLTIDEYKELIHTGKFFDPMVFLECIVQGSDPRNISNIYNLLEEIKTFEGDSICQSSWEELRNLLLSEHKYNIVSIEQSFQAAKTIAEYLHPKRKQVDIYGNNNDSGSSTKLTVEEIDLFKERFNDEF